MWMSLVGLEMLEVATDESHRTLVAKTQGVSRPAHHTGDLGELETAQVAARRRVARGLDRRSCVLVD